jgi:uncharacterized membrane protein YfhO
VPTRAEITRDLSGSIDVRAAGPGLLVLAESWDGGWRATVDDAPADIVRVNQMAMAVALAPATHRVSFRYRPPGLTWGLALAALAACGLVVWSRPC